MLTCLSCRVTFATNENQKEHYKSEWHRYNLMRKVVELEPVTYEFFLKVQKNREAESNQKTEQLVYSCTVCRKHFNSKAVLEQHFQSKKHKGEVEKRAGQATNVNEETTNEQLTLIKAKEQNSKLPLDKQPVDITVGDTSEENEDEDWDQLKDNETEIDIDLNDCLFCPIKSTSLDDNLKHMSIEHSFFVNDLEYCTDLEGLIEYLSEKVKIGLRCIFCPDTKRGYQTLEACQQHMISKGHCKMKSEAADVLEWAPFYDYSQTYPDNDDADGDIDEEFETEEAFQRNNWELVLPSGAVVGHRSLARIYRQKFNPKWLERQERAEQQKLTMSPEDRRRRLSKVMNQYQSIGYKSQNGALMAANPLVLARQKARDIKFFYRLRQSQDFLRVNKVKNISSQMHFRAQTLK